MLNYHTEDYRITKGLEKKLKIAIMAYRNAISWQTSGKELILSERCYVDGHECTALQNKILRGELRDSIITNMTTLFQLLLLDKKKNLTNYAAQRKRSQLNQDLIITKLISTAEV